MIPPQLNGRKKANQLRCSRLLAMVVEGPTFERFWTNRWNVQVSFRLFWTYTASPTCVSLDISLTIRLVLSRSKPIHCRYGPLFV
jgi:hypothetical protein